MIAANMRPPVPPPVPPEVALWAFFEEHRRSGDLDGGVEDGRLWVGCECGAVLVKPAASRHGSDQ